LHTKNDVHLALHVIEALRVQLEGHLDVLVVCPGDFEGEACGRELEEPQPEVAGVGIVIVCLDVADASVIVLKLTLNDKIVVVVPRGIEVIVTAGLAIELAWKYSSPDSPTDTFFGWSLMAGSLATVRTNRSYLNPIARRRT
jgi:hypothetical protein